MSDFGIYKEYRKFHDTQMEEWGEDTESKGFSFCALQLCNTCKIYVLCKNSSYNGAYFYREGNDIEDFKLEFPEVFL